jgi:hypothetical protein
MHWFSIAAVKQVPEKGLETSRKIEDGCLLGCNVVNTGL